MADADRQFVIALRNGFDVEVRRLFLHRAINGRGDMPRRVVPYRRDRYGPLFMKHDERQEMIEFMRAATKPLAIQRGSSL